MLKEDWDVIVPHLDAIRRKVKEMYCKRKIYHCADDLDDAVSEAILEVQAQIHTHDPAKSNIRTFILARTRWAVIHYLRSNRDLIKQPRRHICRLKILLPDPNAALQELDQLAITKETKEAVNLVLAGLKPFERTVLESYYLKGMKDKDIAHKQGVSPQTVWRIRNRCLTKCRATVNP